MRIAFVFQVLAGLLIRFGLPSIGGSTEAWDNPLYFLLCGSLLSSQVCSRPGNGHCAEL
jgi:hypothetical protein